ncbi:MAG TPA: HAD-IIIA family hydrolase [Chitinophagaceae bacterium]|nr:HAD-IIIA family hydrolase [Chitinophagaceae bacterium]
MIIKEAIILAGGLGTRLRESVPDLPKCMAPVAARSFLFYVINYLRSQGVEEFIFSLGYKQELIVDYLHKEFSTLKYKCVIEEEPLGTGGAIQLACREVAGKNVIIANGDTVFKADLHKAAQFHLHLQAECTLLLKPMRNFDRYGVVELEETHLLKSFKEKKWYEQGLINGGLYLLHVPRFLEEEFPSRFSFEKDYLEKFYTRRRIYGQVQDEYFIDIGIPGDYEKAQQEFKPAALDLSKIDKTWTLFLDRDGVINVDKQGSYIFSPEEFVFTEGGPALFKKLTERFGKILVVTNQRGVGRELMTEKTLNAIHQKMLEDINQAGGRIDEIYYCTSVHNDDPRRKPNPGMAYQAKADFPGIDLTRAIVVGNNISDMKFGRNAGLFTVFVRSTKPDQPFPDPDIDLAVDSLEEFTHLLAAAGGQ